MVRAHIRTLTNNESISELNWFLDFLSSCSPHQLKYWIAPQQVGNQLFNSNQSKNLRNRWMVYSHMITHSKFVLDHFPTMLALSCWKPCVHPGHVLVHVGTPGYNLSTKSTWQWAINIWNNRKKAGSATHCDTFPHKHSYR